MEPAIRPEPSPEERKAILAAVEALLGAESSSRANRSAWRDQGIRENVEDLEEEG